MATVRKSTRSHTTIWDSNGRDCLAHQVGMTREELQSWLCSKTVHHHLKHWHKLCIENADRFNDGIAWINEGPEGYYYSSDGLDDDLMLTCLEWGLEMNEQILEASAAELADLAGEESKIPRIRTLIYWARTAHNIVGDNCRKGQLLASKTRKNPAAAYAFAIDILTIAFHSLAYRRSESVWHEIITWGGFGERPTDGGHSDQSDAASMSTNSRHTSFYCESRGPSGPATPSTIDDEEDIIFDLPKVYGLESDVEKTDGLEEVIERGLCIQSP